MNFKGDTFIRLVISYVDQKHQLYHYFFKIETVQVNYLHQTKYTKFTNFGETSNVALWFTKECNGCISFDLRKKIYKKVQKTKKIVTLTFLTF